jgi:hypothetical protein
VIALDRERLAQVIAGAGVHLIGRTAAEQLANLLCVLRAEPTPPHFRSLLGVLRGVHRETGKIIDLDAIQPLLGGTTIRRFWNLHR